MENLCSDESKDLSIPPCEHIPGRIKSIKIYDASVIPEYKMNAMRIYYQLLKSRHPQYKEKKLARKTAEHFKIKLV